jgi:hypothetical protein
MEINNEEIEEGKERWTSQGMWIEGEVAFNPNLTRLEKMTYWFLRNFRRSELKCFPSNAYIGNAMDVSKQTAGVVINALIKEGYLKVKSFNGRKRTLQFCSFTEKHKQYITNFSSQIASFSVSDSRKIRMHTQEKSGDNKNKGKRSRSVVKTTLTKRNADAFTFRKPGGSGGKDNTSLIKEDNTSDDISLPKNVPPRQKLNRRKVATAPKVKTHTNPLEGIKKDIIYFWNKSPGTPSLRIPSNGTAPTKTYNKIVKKILPAVLDDGYSLSKIKRAISIYSNMLMDSYNFGLQSNVSGHRVGLGEFLVGFSNDTKSRMFPNNIVKKGTVWLKECDKSQAHLEKQYGKYINDANPKVTQEFKEMFLHPYTNTTHGKAYYPLAPDWPEILFKELGPAQEKGLTIAEENLFRLATKRLLTFMKVYGVGKPNCILNIPNNPVTLVISVYRAIAESIGPNFEINLGWLTATKTYEERIPSLYQGRSEMPKMAPLEMPWKDYREKRV